MSNDYLIPISTFLFLLIMAVIVCSPSPAAKPVEPRCVGTIDLHAEHVEIIASSIENSPSASLARPEQRAHGVSVLER